VQICPNCGEENPPRFRLCGFCGTALAAELPPQETRKTVTIVFSDLQGSTSLGEKLDPESLREVMSRYFEEMRAALTHHGGTIEKYIGDAVMAVFGLPRVHEDDALRAVRAADEMKRRLAQLNDELERRWGVTLVNRTGVNTGVVVAGDATTGQRLVTGDTVNVAARLEQAAPGLEVLIGEPTYRLVRRFVDVDPVEPLELKGKTERVGAYRLLGVHDGPLESGWRPLVGREEELGVLTGELERAVAERSCRTVTLLAEAGVGKSRLLAELVDRAAETATVLRGRCLPYGRGITFWPLGEIARAAAGVTDGDSPEGAHERLLELVGADEPEIADRISSAIGLQQRQFPVEELFWATRRFVEILAARRPLVLVWEDLHWAEMTLLDLIERVAQSVAGVPVLMVCSGRHALLEVRPDVLAGTGSRIDLRPLGPEASERMMDDLLGGAELDAGAKRRITEAAEGNPLFVEQMLSMLVDEGALRLEDGRWTPAVDLAELPIPPTIHALLGARLDLLAPEERAVIDPASVVGMRFEQGAVEELVPEAIRGEVPQRLHALMSKQLVHHDPEQSQIAEVYRFQHVLIRDAAYQALLKRARAQLHERFADWGERVNRERNRGTEYEEILGYHLEQAYRYLEGLGPIDDHGRGLAERAAAKLGAAGVRAFAREDMPAAANLLRRAVELIPEGDPRRIPLLPDLGEALIQIGELEWADLYLQQLVSMASDLRDSAAEHEGRLGLLVRQRFAGGSGEHWSEEALVAAEAALEVFQREGNDRRLAKAWRMAMDAHGVVYSFGDAATAARRAVDHARSAGDARGEAKAATAYAMAALHGPTPVPEALERCRETLTVVESNVKIHAFCRLLMSPLHAMEGDFETARRLYRDARATLETIGATLYAAHTSLEASTVEFLAGDPEAAERELRRDYATLAALKERFILPTVAANLALALCAQERHDEAVQFAATAKDLSAADDLESQALWRSVEAVILARNARFEEAELLAAEAVALFRRTDGIVKLADAIRILASIHDARGQQDLAIAEFEEAIALYRRKGNIVAERSVRSLLSANVDARAVDLPSAL
jgi:class 3 adenylate cyclase/tetratricopeptide (TPR) repeat protein